MTETDESLFASGLDRYKAGEAPETLIPLFKEVCDRTPKNATGWACLAWLYLLNDKPQSALKAAQKSIKLEPRSPQARVNLAAAMLESGQKGVRAHIEVAQQVMALDEQIRQEVAENIEDGLNRKPDWKSLERIKHWLLES